MVKQIVFVGFVFLFVGCQERNPQLQATFSGQDSTLASADASIDSIFTRVKASLGQTIYVPVYSHIYQQNQQTTFNLTATLSFRNVDLAKPVTLEKVLYYDSDGKLVKKYLKQPRQIGPLASTSFVVEEDDLRGGVGANFIIVWHSESPVFPPVVEAVMISTASQQGVSFISRGRVIENKTPKVTE